MQQRNQPAKLSKMGKEHNNLITSPYFVISHGLQLQSISSFWLDAIFHPTLMSFLPVNLLTDKSFTMSLVASYINIDSRRTTDGWAMVISLRLARPGVLYVVNPIWNSTVLPFD